MEKSQLDKYLKALEEYVIDEGKIVTYKWLSRALKIHYNTSKQLLHIFATAPARKENEAICTTHWISGYSDSGEFVVTIANEIDLNSVRSKLAKIQSEHVYSLQKGKCVEDLQLLYAVDKFTGEKRSSTIKCAEALPRTQTLNVKPVKVQPERKLENVKKQQEPAKVSDVKADKDKEDMTKAVSDATINKPKEEKSKKPPAKKGNSISSMFSAQTSKPKPQAKVDEKKKTSPVSRPKEEKPKDEQNASTSRNESPAKKTKAAKKSKTIKVEIQEVEKKRKRIQVFSDSDESEGDVQVERSPSPEPQAEPDTEPMVVSDKEDEVEAGDSQSTRKRKKRKIVDKHVMNDDGYMETKKEVVFVTDSEDESTPTVSNPPQRSVAKEKSPKKKEHVPKQKSPKKKEPSKSASPVKKGRGKPAVNDGKKQPTLLSFFKKN